MSQENVEILREGYLALNRGDFETAIEMLDPDVEYDVSRRTSDPGVYRGHEGVRENLLLMTEQWAAMRFEPQNFIVAVFRVRPWDSEDERAMADAH